MIIGLSSKGDSLDSEIDPRFGRAAWFVIYDTENDRHESLNNTVNSRAAQGAGTQTVETLSKSGARSVITGHCGPNAHRALTAAGITVYTGARGTVREAIDLFRKGGFDPADSPDVSGHWR